MLDPTIKAALFTLVVTILTALAQRYLPGFPISAELINSVAVVVVSFLVTLLGYEGFKAAAPNLTKKLQERGLLPKN